MLYDREQGFRRWAEENDPRDYPERHNVADAERWLSALGGGTLAAIGLSRRSWGGLLLAAAGGYLIYRGVSGNCPAYRAWGVSTANQGPRLPAVSQHQGVRLEESVVIAKSAQELYDFWRRLENLPRFMRHLKTVKTLPNGTSHWTAEGPVGLAVSWGAEIVGDEPCKLISWRSLPHSQIQNAGAVRFEDAEGGTRVHVSLTFNPPAGKMGAALARMLGDDPAKQIREDLGALKKQMERGSQDKRVNEAIAESFPASDPPSFTRSAATEER